MATYHRNFEFRVSPRAAQRSSRFVTPATGDKLLIGAPVVVDDTVPADALGRQKVVAATGAQPPKPGQSGILVFEHMGDGAYAGSDAVMTTYSDLAHAPLNQSVQVVHGDKIKIALINTEDSTFLNTRAYEGRTMVAGLGATPTLAVGNYLTPGTGNDTAGYWAETATAENAWLVVTAVDAAAGLVEAEFLF